MSYIIRTRCPNGCEYKSGYTCVASECPYQTGDVRYDIRLNAEDKPTKINAEVKRELKQFAERLKEQMNEGEYMGVKYKQGVFSENDIDEILKEFMGREI